MTESSLNNILNDLPDFILVNGCGLRNLLLDMIFYNSGFQKALLFVSFPPQPYF